MTQNTEKLSEPPTIDIEVCVGFEEYIPVLKDLFAYDLMRRRRDALERAFSDTDAPSDNISELARQLLIQMFNNGDSIWTPRSGRELLDILKGIEARAGVSKLVKILKSGKWFLCFGKISDGGKNPDTIWVIPSGRIVDLFLGKDQELGSIREEHGVLPNEDAMAPVDAFERRVVLARGRAPVDLVRLGWSASPVRPRRRTSRTTEEERVQERLMVERLKVAFKDKAKDDLQKRRRRTKRSMVKSNFLSHIFQLVGDFLDSEGIAGDLRYDTLKAVLALFWCLDSSVTTGKKERSHKDQSEEYVRVPIEFSVKATAKFLHLWLKANGHEVTLMKISSHFLGADGKISSLSKVKIFEVDGFVRRVLGLATEFICLGRAINDKMDALCRHPEGHPAAA